jgi:hypothetical protein
MMLGMFGLLYLFSGTVCGFIASGIASMKYRSGCLFFVLGFVLGPLAILGAAMMSRDEGAATGSALRRGALRVCPACRQPVDPLASICPSCRSALIPTPPQPGEIEQFGKWLGQLLR